MRGKRSKQYRKLMQQYGLSFGFREPYQVLLDADMIRDADRFKMDLVPALERTLHGKVKPMITQCSMRHLYSLAFEPGASFLIDKAKLFERRRCDHRPEEYPVPLSTLECLSSVVDPKGSKTNKHRYVIASQELDVRKAMRGILGVPLIYISRSVMIMEPMARITTENRAREEKSKFRAGLKSGRVSGSQGVKRKREDDDETIQTNDGHPGAVDSATKRKKSNVKGPKEPNPLSVKKSKKSVGSDVSTAILEPQSISYSDKATGDSARDDSQIAKTKRKRRRKHKSNGGDGDAADARGKGLDGSEE